MTPSTSSQPQHRPVRWLVRTLIVATALATSAQALCVSLANSTACPLFQSSYVDNSILSDMNQYGITMQNFTTVQEFDAAVFNATGFETSAYSCPGYNSTVRIPYQNTVLCAIAVNENQSLDCKGTNTNNPPALCTSSCSLYESGLSAMISSICPTDSTSKANLAALNTVCTTNNADNWANLHDNSTGCINALQNEAATCGLGSAADRCTFCQTNSTAACCAGAATTCDYPTTATTAGPSATSSFISPPSTTSTSPSTGSKTGLSTGALGGIIGGSVAVVLIALVLFLCMRRSRKSTGGKASNLSRQMSNSSARYNISSPKIQEEGISAASTAPIPMTTLPPIAAENAKFGAGAVMAGATAAAIGHEATGKQSYCQALYPYQASMADELDLTPGDIVNVQRVFDDGWAVGVNMNTSNEGAFPVVCVMFVDESALDDDFEDVNMHSMAPMTLREEDEGRRSPSGRNSPRSSLPSRSSSPVHLPRRNSSIRDSTVIVPGSSPMTSSPLAGGLGGGRMTPPIRDTMLSDASSINRWWDGEK